MASAAAVRPVAILRNQALVWEGDITALSGDLPTVVDGAEFYMLEALSACDGGNVTRPSAGCDPQARYYAIRRGYYPCNPHLKRRTKF